MLFIDNKYTRWYYDIVNRAQTRVFLDSYSEAHHIIPRSLNGKDTEDNLVKLTAREHFIAHWLLTKMVSSKKHQYQMWNAFSCMLYRERPGQERYKVTGRIFENIKTAGSKIKSIRMSGAGNPMYGRKGELCPAFGRKWTEEHRKNASASHKGIIRTQESRAKQSASVKGRKKSDLHKEKISEALTGKNNPMYGKKLSAETIAKRTTTMKKNKLAKKLAKENQNS
jgi:hypothetical protein